FFEAVECQRHQIGKAEILTNHDAQVLNTEFIQWDLAKLARAPDHVAIEVLLRPDILFKILKCLELPVFFEFHGLPLFSPHMIESLPDFMCCNAPTEFLPELSSHFVRDIVLVREIAYSPQQIVVVWIFLIETVRIA